MTVENVIHTLRKFKQKHIKNRERFGIIEIDKIYTEKYEL